MLKQAISLRIPRFVARKPIIKHGTYLKKYAAENGIDITGLKKKDEILDVIKSAENGEVSGPTEPAEPDTSMESLFEQ